MRARALDSHNGSPCAGLMRAYGLRFVQNVPYQNTVKMQKRPTATSPRSRYGA